MTADRSAGPSRNGPPDAVRMSDATRLIGSPTRHCQIAECSESIGRSQASGLANGIAGIASPRRSAARARASGITRWPPATSVSLFAVATTLPARERGERPGRRLTIPPVATTTRSTSSRVAIGRRQTAVAGRPAAGRTAIARRPEACAPARRGRRRSRRRRARRPRTRPDAPARTSSVCVPIEPVEPRTATRASRGPAQRNAATTYRSQRPAPRTGTSRPGRGSPPWPGISVARVLGAGGPLQHRLGEVAGLGGERQRAARGRAPPTGGWPRPDEHQRRRRPSRRRSRRSGPRTSSTARCGSGTCGRRTACPTK